MLLFNDVITGDELCSDAYDPKLIDDIVYEVDCQMLTIKDGEVDIGELKAIGLQCQASRTAELPLRDPMDLQVPTLPLRNSQKSSKMVLSPSSTL